ncbi:MAG: hypothetical protein ACREEB_00890 [Caulobacteraceae bacterium]
MDLLKDRRVIVIGGAALALAAGLAVAVLVALRQDAEDDSPPASVGGLVVQTAREGYQKLDPTMALRCFVDGKLIGQMTVNDCARKNGVATGALDVGVDASGGLAAAKPPTVEVIPPPPPGPPDEQAQADTDEAGAQIDEASAGGPVQPCWNYSGGNWSRTPTDMTLGACAQTLFAGQCVSPGAAAYGRWGGRTLRLVLGRVEVSSDNRSFRTLTAQQAGCAIPDTE